MYIYFYVTSFNRILNAADGQTQTQPRPILHWSVYVHFICISHYFRKLLSPPCHPFPSKMFREDTTETSHWRAGLWETLSYTMQVNWSYASLRQTSPPTPVWTKFFRASLTALFLRGYSFHLSCFGNLSMTKFTICIFKLRLGGEISHSVDSVHQGYFACAYAIFEANPTIIITALILLFWFMVDFPSLEKNAYNSSKNPWYW